MKFTISAILSIQLSGIKYIHTVVQPSPPSISMTLSSPQYRAPFTFGQVLLKTNDPCLLDMESQLLLSRAQNSSYFSLTHMLTLLKSLLCYSGPVVHQSCPLDSLADILVISTLEFGDRDLKKVIITLSYTAAAAKSLQLCLTLCNPIAGSPPGSPVPGILQARTLEWVTISFSNA